MTHTHPENFLKSDTYVPKKKSLTSNTHSEKVWTIKIFFWVGVTL